MQEMINWGVINLFSSPNPTENAIIVLSSNIFYSEMGSIRYLALLISETVIFIQNEYSHTFIIQLIIYYFSTGLSTRPDSCKGDSSGAGRMAK